jgi:2-dehydropantoate 2-reductase
VSLQNGVDNISILQKNCPEHVVVGGMVAWNAVQVNAEGDTFSPLHFHKSTSGPLSFSDALPKNVVASLQRAGFQIKLYPTSAMKGVMYGKLLVNLINSINALSGMYTCMHISM